MFQGTVTDAYELNLHTGSLTQKTTTGLVANAKLNAFGYNPVDNYIWGVVVGSNQLVRIGSDYDPATIKQYVVTNLPQASYVVGDVDRTGKMYVTQGGNQTEASVYVVNLNNTSPNPSATVLPTTIKNVFINDWAVSPIDNNLYALSSGTGASALTLYRINTTTGQTTTLGKVASATGGDPNQAIKADTYGAVFMDVNGTFYVVGNTTGLIHSFAQPDQLPASTTAVITAVYQASGPKSGNNDGARCAGSAVAPLPVELVSFTATAVSDRYAHLAWRTASELHNAYFEVQHSVDGQVFTAIGQVAGHGSTGQASTYNFRQATLADAVLHYYRLRQVDLDGTSTFSPVRVVQFAPTEPVLLGAVPNPSIASELRLRVQVAGPAPLLGRLSLTNSLGQLVWQQATQLAPGTTDLIPATHLAPGVYWLRLTGGSLPNTPGMRVSITQ